MSQHVSCFSYYPLQAALGSHNRGDSTKEQLESLCLSLPNHEDIWRELLDYIGEKQSLGYCFRRAGASLALAVQKKLAGQCKPLHLSCQFQGAIIGQQSTAVICSTKNKGGASLALIGEQGLEPALTLALKEQLTREYPELASVHLVDWHHCQTNKPIHRVELVFQEYRSGAQWVSIGAGQVSEVAALDAILDGFVFGLDPRIQDLPSQRRRNQNTSDPFGGVRRIVPTA